MKDSKAEKWCREFGVFTDELRLALFSFTGISAPQDGAADGEG